MLWGGAGRQRFLLALSRPCSLWPPRLSSAAAAAVTSACDLPASEQSGVLHHQEPLIRAALWGKRAHVQGECEHVDTEMTPPPSCSQLSKSSDDFKWGFFLNKTKDLSFNSHDQIIYSDVPFVPLNIQNDQTSVFNSEMFWVIPIHFLLPAEKTTT